MSKLTSRTNGEVQVAGVGSRQKRKYIHRNMVIETGIPLPPKGTRPGNVFTRMEVGDSVFMEGVTVNNCPPYTRRARAEGKRFANRTVAGGVRIWRTK